MDETGGKTTAESEREGFEVSDQGQNIGGGKDERKIDVGEINDGNEFSKTDQSITQAAPGKRQQTRRRAEATPDVNPIFDEPEQKLNFCSGFIIFTKKSDKICL